MCVCVLERNGARSSVPTIVRTRPQMGGVVDPIHVICEDIPVGPEGTQGGEDVHMRRAQMCVADV